MRSTARLEGLRARFRGRLPDRCTIKRPTSSSDGAGGRTSTYATVASDEACYLYPAARERSEQIVAERVQSEAEWILLVRHDLDVREADRVEVNGLELEVAVGLSTGRSLEVLRTIPCVKVG